MRIGPLLVMFCATACAAPSPHADLVAAVPAGSRVIPAAPASESLVAAITRADAALFDAVFDACDAAKVRALVTDDFEFHHDHGGRIAGSGAQFAARIAEQCAARDEHSVVSRRELVPDTLAVFPDGEDRAMQTGIHRFYEHVPGKPEQLVGIARFAHVWRREDGVWRAERVLSYDHNGVSKDAP
jgi:hypothetical protein